ncbi:MAG: hypothetical protein L6R37_003884 [Teloschistes peruensis]|nr:MAG: hypothetical protein L6R37_003884 [Teloschistes peruensis]
MVSFSCESCISEDQKYQGALYKEKSAKQARKSVKISTPTTPGPRKAFVEDAPDSDSHNALAVVDRLPEAPSPPPAVSAKNTQPVNVFDFLVNAEIPNASNVSLGGTRAPMEMKPTARPLFEANRQSSIDSGTDHEYDSAFERDGYAYGHKPVPSNVSLKQIEYKTPRPKNAAPYASNQGSLYELDGAERKSTDKKRKRHNIDDLDLTAARPPSRQELDSVMLDADPAAPVLHSGLTGGLNRLLSKSTKLPPSPEYSNSSQQDRSPPTVVKRTKRVITTVDGEKVRKTSSGALVRVRKIPTSHRPSDESNRPRKQPRSSLLKEEGADSQRDNNIIRPKRTTPKAIEYHHSHRAPSSTRGGNQQQQQEDPREMVLYRSRAKLFLSFVNKGPESEAGCSINKALKRYHRERGERGLGKQEEEKELWKSLRVKRNERGEVVILGV